MPHTKSFIVVCFNCGRQVPNQVSDNLSDQYDTTIILVTPDHECEALRDPD